MVVGAPRRAPAGVINSSDSPRFGGSSHCQSVDPLDVMHESTAELTQAALALRRIDGEDQRLHLTGTDLAGFVTAECLPPEHVSSRQGRVHEDGHLVEREMG